jgi:DNA-binding NarL/FixJ family response regulator
MLQVLVIEPSNRTASLLKMQKEVKVTAAAGLNDPRTQHTAAYDLVLVSAALPADRVLAFLEQHRSGDAQNVVIDVAETDSQVIPFLEAGAVGYVPKGASARQIASILIAIAQGKPPFAPTVGTALVERMHELLALQQQHAGEAMRQNSADPGSLTAREREILRLIREGASNQAIAGELMIELGTVKNHVHNILKKLNVTRRAQAASYVDLLEQVN